MTTAHRVPLKALSARAEEQEDAQPGEQEDRGDGVIDIHEAIGQETGDRQECAAEDRGDAADAERHGDPCSFPDVSPASAQPELGVEGAEEDVRHVERPERAFLEDRLELVAVAGPPAGGIETDQERSVRLRRSRRAGEAAPGVLGQHFLSLSRQNGCPRPQ